MSEQNSELEEGVTANVRPDHGVYDADVPGGTEPDFDAEDTDETEDDVQDVDKSELDPTLTGEGVKSDPKPESAGTEDQKNVEEPKPVAASPELNPTSSTPTPSVPSSTPTSMASVPTPPKGGTS